MALCSLSNGKIFVLYFLASFIINAPAETKHSLFAIQTFFEFLIDSIKGLRPARPTIPAITISVLSFAH